MRLIYSLLLLTLLAVPAGSSFAQTLGQVVSPVLTIDREALFAQTAFGQRVARNLEEESNALAEETRKIEAALEEEERSLTAKRETLTPAEFRVLADAFDEKVVALRTDRDTAQNNFVQRYEDAQRSFFQQIGPVLGQMMQERGAVLIMDKRSVLLSVNAIDVTEAAIQRIDATLGDGTDDPTTEAPDNTAEEPSTGDTPE